jgi:transposase InsO family protein
MNHPRPTPARCRAPCPGPSAPPPTDDPVYRLERVLSDNGSGFTSLRFRQVIESLGASTTRIRAGRPPTNGHVENLHKTILDECWRPSFARSLYPAYTALKRDLDAYLRY